MSFNILCFCFSEKGWPEVQKLTLLKGSKLSSRVPLPWHWLHGWPTKPRPRQCGQVTCTCDCQPTKQLQANCVEFKMRTTFSFSESNNAQKRMSSCMPRLLYKARPSTTMNRNSGALCKCDVGGSSSCCWKRCDVLFHVITWLQSRGVTKKWWKWPSSLAKVAMRRRSVVTVGQPIPSRTSQEAQRTDAPRPWQLLHDNLLNESTRVMGVPQHWRICSPLGSLSVVAERYPSMPPPMSPKFAPGIWVLRAKHPSSLHIKHDSCAWIGWFWRPNPNRSAKSPVTADSR